MHVKIIAGSDNFFWFSEWLSGYEIFQYLHAIDQY